MKKYILTVLMMIMTAGAVMAQSSMTDQQIIAFVMEEQEKGTSQQQIVTQLMKRGVTIEQLKKVKQKYERQMSDGGLGTKDITTTGKDRLRKNNGKKAGQGSVSQYRQKDGNRIPTNTYNEKDESFC